MDIASSIDILYIAAFRVLDIQFIVRTTELEIDLRQAGGRSDSRGLIIVGYLRLVGAFARVDSFDLSHHRAYKSFHGMRSQCSSSVELDEATARILGSFADLDYHNITC